MLSLTTYKYSRIFSRPLAINSKTRTHDNTCFLATISHKQKIRENPTVFTDFWSRRRGSNLFYKSSALLFIRVLECIHQSFTNIITYDTLFYILLTTESEAILNIQKRAIFNNFCVKIARFTYSPHNSPHERPHYFLRHLTQIKCTD